MRLRRSHHKKAHGGDRLYCLLHLFSATTEKRKGGVTASQVSNFACGHNAARGRSESSSD
jgi:hypothetical protein